MPLDTCLLMGDPVAGSLPGNCVWLKPELVVQIEFTEWTPDGHLRHSKFVGLRDAKNPREIEREG